MRKICLTVADEAPSDNAWMLLPRPIDDWTQRFMGIELDKVTRVHEIAARNISRLILYNPQVTMSYRRGLRFDTPHGPVDISHFSEPLWVLANGTNQKLKLRIRISEQD